MDFIRSRLTRPRLSTNYILRERGISLLNKSRNKPLTLVVAAAGYGKSILVSQWLDQIETKSCWVELSSECNEFRTFTEYIALGIRSIIPDSLEEVLNMVNSQVVTSNPVITETLINKLLDIEEDICIVLDDYHLIHNMNKEIHQLIELMLEHLYDRLKIILISRNDPPLKLKQLIAYDSVSQIRGKELRFTSDEISALSEQVYNYKLSKEQIKSILYSTEGWIIAIRIQLNFLSEGVDIYENNKKVQHKLNNLIESMFRDIISYKENVIYKGLLLASFSSRFSLEMVAGLMNMDKINNHSDSDPFKEKFRETINKSPFIFSLDDEGEWFRFHHLVHDFLCKKVQERFSKTQKNKIYLEVSSYFSSIQLYEEAIQHALLGEAPESAVTVIIDNYETLLDTEQFQRLNKWINMLPLGAVETHPELILIRAILSEAKNNTNELANDIELLGRFIGQTDQNTASGNRLWSGYYAFSAGSLFYSKSYVSALEMADKAVLLAKNNKSYIYSFVTIIKSITLQILGKGDLALELIDNYLALIQPDHNMLLLRANLCQVFILSLQSKINKIAGPANLVKKISQDQDKWVTHGMANYYMAASAYYRNKLDEIHSLFEDSKKNSFAGRPDFIVQTNFYAIMQMLAINDYEGIKQVLSMTHDYVGKLNRSDLDNLVGAFEVELELLNKSPQNARKLATKVDFTDYPTIFYFYIPAITRIKLMMANSDYWNIEETRHELEALIERKEKMHMDHLLVQLYPLMALWHFSHGEKKEAFAFLRKSLCLSEESGFIRNFVDLGDDMWKLLKALHVSEPDDRYITKLLNAFERENKQYTIAQSATNGYNSAVLSSEIEELSDREIELLRFVAEGYRNKEIADKMFLSPNSVKKYLYDVYQKMEVNTRTHAIKKAKSLNLI